MKARTFEALSLISFTGSVVTTWLGSKRAERILNQARVEADSSVKLSFKERFKKVWKCYIPAGITYTMGVTSLIIADKKNAKTIAELSASVVGLKKLYDKYGKTVEKKFGIDTRELLEKEINSVGDPPKEVPETLAKETEDDTQLYYLGWGYDDYFQSTPKDIELAEYAVNKKIKLCGSATVGDFIEALGLEVKDGISIYFGWSDEMLWENAANDPHGDWLEIDTSLSDLDDGLQCEEFQFSILPSDAFEEKYRW